MRQTKKVAGTRTPKKKDNAFERIVVAITEEIRESEERTNRRIGEFEKRSERRMDEGFARVENRLDSVVQMQLDDHAHRIKILETKVLS